jgi:hypothetical protein
MLRDQFADFEDEVVRDITVLEDSNASLVLN